MEFKDITKTGAVSFLGVRGADLYGQSGRNPLDDLMDDNTKLLLDYLYKLAQRKATESAKGHIGYSALSTPSLYEVLNISLDSPLAQFGESYWDLEGLLVNPDSEMILNTRANNLSAIVQAANGILKGTILAGSTFINGTVGLVAGLGQGIANTLDDNPDTSFSQGLWDNPVNNLVGEITELSELYLPNYRTTEQEAGPWYSWNNLASANFIFDTVVKNMGFTVGAVLAGGVYTKGISLGAQAIGALRLGKATAATIEAGQKAMLAATATRATKALAGSIMGAHAEATIEAYHASLDFIKTETAAVESMALELLGKALEEFINNGGQLLEIGVPDNENSDPEALLEYYKKISDIDLAKQLAMSEIEKQSKYVGNMTGPLNTAVLTINNLLMFGKMFAGGWKAGRQVHRTTTRATKEAMKEALAAAKAGDPSKLKHLNEIVAKAELTGYLGLSQTEKSMVEETARHILGPKAGATWAAVKGPLREGNEEMMLGAISQASVYRYENEVDRIFDASLDIESTYKTRGLLESIVEGVKSQYGDIDKYEEAFVGAVTGLMGSPTFGKKSNATDQTYLGRSKWIGLTGGTITEVRDYLKNRRNKDDIARSATEVLRNSNLAGNIKHLIAQTRFNNDMSRAHIEDDEKEYKDARTASIFEMVSHLKRAGRLDLLESAMQTIAEFSEEDAALIVEETEKWISANDPDILNKILSKKKIEKDIAHLESTLEDVQTLSSESGDPSYIEEWRETMEAKLAELDAVNADIRSSKAVRLSPYIHSDGTQFTAKEVLEDLNKRVSNFKKIIDTISLAQDLIDEATSQTLTNEQLDTLTWYRVMMDDWNERALGITDDWKTLITRLAEDPKLKDAIEAISEVDKLLEEAGYDKDSKVLLGGRFDTLKKIKNYHSILQQLLEAVSAGGMTLSYLLTNNTKLEGTDLTVGEVITKQLKLILGTDTKTTKDVKDSFLKGLDDLVSIGKGHRKYNQLLDEYLKNPEKIDLAHADSENRANAAQSSSSISQSILDIDWGASIGTIAKQLRANAKKIDDAGGFDKFIKALTPELLNKAKLALKLVMGIDSLDSLIQDEGVLDDHAILLRGMVEDHLDGANTLQELARALKDGIQEGELEEKVRQQVPKDQNEDLTIQQILAAESTLYEFIEDSLEKAVASVERAQKALDDEEAILQQARELTELEEKRKNMEVPTEAVMSPPLDILPVASEDEDIGENNPTAQKDATKYNKKSISAPIPGEPGYNRRRQISLYYLHGLDRMSLPLYYRENLDLIPKGVDKDAFLLYIEKVHDKLVKSGAYTYISGVNPESKLKEGQEIRFTTDPELNKEAGVTVILMVTTNELGLDLVIGSLPTSLDFQSLERTRGRNTAKTKEELYPGDKELYDTLCKELLQKVENGENMPISSITTKVESLKGGFPALSALNRSVKSVFKDLKVPITVISNNSKKSESVTNPIEIIDPINGQIYVYVTASTGKQVPLLCVSTPLKDLDKNDWYIKSTIAAVLLLSDALNIGKAKSELSRWIPTLANYYINYTTSKTGKKLIIFSLRDDSDESKYNVIYSINFQDDGSISELDALKFILSISKTKIKASNGNLIYPTTNVNPNKLNDSEYMDHIVNYLKINVMENSPHTIDDWFTYEATEIQRSFESKNKSRKKKESTPISVSGEIISTDEGDVKVSNAGSVQSLDGLSVTKEQEKELTSPISVDKSDEVIGVNSETLSTKVNLASLFGRGESEFEMPDVSTRKRRRPKTLLITDTLDDIVSIELTTEDIEKVAALFPLLSKEGRIVLVKGLIKIIDENGNPRKAYGLFKNGILYISDQSPKGTAFHESFHYITEALLSTEERTKLFSLAAEEFKTSDTMLLEEILSEKFREFMNDIDDSSIIGRIKTIFKKLKHIIRNIRGKEHYLDSLFWEIYRGKLKLRKENLSTTANSNDLFIQELIRYKDKKLRYENLDQEAKEYFIARGLSPENYDRLNIEQKEIILHCM